MKRRLTSPLFNSEELLREFPFLVNDPHWHSFKCSYDAKEAIERKKEEYRKAQGIIANRGITKLKHHCNIITKPLLRKLLYGKDLEKAQAQEKIASEIIADYFLELIESPEKADQLALTITKINEDPNCGLNYHVQIAFLFFLHRNKRLPSKKELGVETLLYENSREESVNWSGSDYQFGDKINNSYVYAYYPDEEGDSVKLVDPTHWRNAQIDGKVNWTKDTLTPLGFKGLPQHNQLRLGCFLSQPQR